MKFLVILFLMFSIDSFAGERKYNQVCVACHGKNGNSSIDMYPNLAGQKKSYLIKQLNDFKSGKRKDPIMKAYADMLTPTEISTISKFLSKQQCK